MFIGIAVIVFVTVVFKKKSDLVSNGVKQSLKDFFLM